MPHDSERVGTSAFARRSLVQPRWLVVAVSGALLLSGFIAAWLPTPPIDARLALLTAAAAVAGLLIAGNACDGIRRGQVTIELLVAIATIGALASGDVLVAAAVSFAFACGAWLEGRVPRHADAAHAGGRLERAAQRFSSWYTPVIIALAAGALMSTEDIAFALTLLLIAIPRALLAAASSNAAPPRALRHLVFALVVTAALLGAVLAGAVGMIAAIAIQQASVLLLIHRTNDRARLRA